MTRCFEQDDIIQKEIKQGVIADPYEMDMAVDGLGQPAPGQPAESAPPSAAGMDLGAPVTEPDLEKQGKKTEAPDGRNYLNINIFSLFILISDG